MVGAGVVVLGAAEERGGDDGVAERAGAEARTDPLEFRVRAARARLRLFSEGDLDLAAHKVHPHAHVAVAVQVLDADVADVGRVPGRGGH